MLMLYLLSLVLELLLFVPLFWNIRKFAVAPLLVLIGFSTSGLVIEYANMLSIGIGILAVFRVINLARIAQARMHAGYLFRATFRTSRWLLGYHIALVAANFIANRWLGGGRLVAVYGWTVLVAASAVFFITLHNLRKTKHVSVIENFADSELPTVTVAIPARNETQDLEDCIRSILANNYPKLEVIVLDDCSGDRTPEVIRGFAHDGVRFVPGSLPEERWLAKNQAYEKLTEEASGELILFCGVDVRFGPEAIRALVTTMLTRKKDMVSILPRRFNSKASETFIQPMRYWWELALPRRLFNRPPVLSTCWLIRHKALERLGGFKAVCHAIIPEGYFARELIKTDGYSFVRADDQLDVQTRKSLIGQRETAIRMRYPQLRRRLELLPVVSVINVLGLLAPFAIVAFGLWHGFGSANWLALGASIFLVLTHISIVQVSNPANVLVAVINFPLAVVAEFILGYTSMWQYEFGIIEWKGRNICIPVMHVVPHLPEIKA